MDLIDIRQLRAFQLLALTGSFTAAGKAMFVTQSAVSHSIKALETSLDCTLLDRSGKQVALTAASASPDRTWSTSLSLRRPRRGSHKMAIPRPAGVMGRADLDLGETVRLV